MKKLLLILGFALLCPTALFAEDCDFCKKDHANICKGECTSAPEADAEKCVKKCIKAKCKSTCKKPETDKPKADPASKDPAQKVEKKDKKEQKAGKAK